MTGQQLKQKILQSGVSQKQIADALGTSRQSLASILRAKDVHSGTIERVSKVLNVPISSLYGENGSAVASNHSVAAANPKVEGLPMNTRVEFLERLLEEKEKMIEEKERTIKILLKTKE